MMTIAEALALVDLPDSDTPMQDKQLLLCFVLDCSAAFLRTWPDKQLTKEQQRRYNALVQQRKEGKPVAHLIGKRGFWTLDLYVSPATLIPRPDTELLVEYALSLDLPAQARVLDLGTGTGAIALALASERPSWEITASDCVDGAVLLAKKNRDLYGLHNVDIVQSRWFESIAQQKFDLIVSNPPYIDACDPHLEQGDLRYEARSALVAGDEGLADIEAILMGARTYLKPDAVVVIEHGYQQGAAVRNLMARLAYRDIRTFQDHGSNDRMTVARF